MINYKALAGEELLKLSPYIPGKPIEEVKRESGVEKVIKLASNENPYGPSPKAVKAFKDFAPELTRYPAGDAYSLRKALASKLNVKMENILCGAGSDEIIQLLYIAFLPSGTYAVSPSPSFSEYEILARSLRANCRWVETKEDFTPDFDALLQAVDENVRFVILANPNNPTGIAFGEKELTDFLNKLDDGVMVVADEAYIEFAERKDMPDILNLMNKYKNLMSMRTFSKAYGLASLRCGYLVAPEECVDVLERVRPPFNVNMAAQAAAEAALGEDDHIKNVIEKNALGKKYLYGAFEEMGLDFIPSETNFILVKTGYGKKVFENLLKEGVIVRFLGGSRLKDYIRVSIGAREENEIFISKLKKVLKR